MCFHWSPVKGCRSYLPRNRCGFKMQWENIEWVIINSKQESVLCAAWTDHYSKPDRFSLSSKSIFIFSFSNLCTSSEHRNFQNAPLPVILVFHQMTDYLNDALLDLTEPQVDYCIILHMLLFVDKLEKSVNGVESNKDFFSAIVKMLVSLVIRLTNL